MGKISKRIINQDLENHIFEVFIDTLAETKTPSDIKNFIEDLLSPIEKAMLAKRLSIAVLLSKGHTYDQIDNTLKVSRPTIMTVSYWLKNGNNGYKKAVQKIINNQKKEALINRIEELMLELTPPKNRGTVGFIKKQNKGKEIFKKKQKNNLL